MLRRVLVCIPTYNESANILEILERFSIVIHELSSAYEISILIIDDNSPDGTADLVERANFSRVHILSRSEKLGLGPAYLAGFSWGLERDFQYFVECDADGSHQPEELSVLLGASDISELVIGTRWMDGGSVLHWPIHRKAISRIGTWYARTILHLPYRDLTSGYRVISRLALERIHLSEVQTLGYGFQIEMAMRIHDAGLSIAQVPITFIERTHGESKMSKRIVLEALIQTTRWAFQGRKKTR